MFRISNIFVRVYLWALLAGSLVFAMSTGAMAFEVSAQKIVRAKLVGKTGNIKVVGTKKGTKWVVQLYRGKNAKGDSGLQWSLSDAGELNIEASSLSSGVTLVIKGPSRPLSIQWSNGQHQFAQWSQPLNIFQKAGSIQVERSSGHFKISQKKGSVTVTKHKGKIETDLYGGQLQMTHSEGEAHLSNFSGSVAVEKFKGELYLSGYSGKYQLKNSSGRLVFKTSRGPLVISNFRGRIEGRSTQGVVEGTGLRTQNVRITTTDGAVQLSGVKGRFNLGTTKGYIKAPKGLKYSQIKKLKQMTGTVSGTGYTYVRTESGDINIK